jgi:hypothetical protein
MKKYLLLPLVALGLITWAPSQAKAGVQVTFGFGVPAYGPYYGYYGPDYGYYGGYYPGYSYYYHPYWYRRHPYYYHHRYWHHR